MKTIRFTYNPQGYTCSEPSDQSGEYVKAGAVAELHAAAKAALHTLSELIDAFGETEQKTEDERVLTRLEVAVFAMEETYDGATT